MLPECAAGDLGQLPLESDAPHTALIKLFIFLTLVWDGDWKTKE